MTYIPPKSDGGPAFPYRKDDRRGMSLLDYFAAKAMQGILTRQYPMPIPTEIVASSAYQLADAMIAQREYWIARRHIKDEAT